MYHEQREIAALFPAMNTTIELLLYPDVQRTAPDAVQNAQESALVSHIERLFAETEACLSRFRAESELSRMNAAGGIAHASPLLWDSVCAAIAMARRTNGIFDPTILTALYAAGYTESFERLGQRGLCNTLPYSIATHNRYQQIALDPATHTIRLPFGAHLDLGGIAKGRTVDRASTLIRAAGFRNFMVNAGGDLYVSGRHATRHKEWRVAVLNPVTCVGDLTYLAVRDAAVATSAVTQRRWHAHGQTHNHVIDPRTGQSVWNAVAAVTVVAPTTEDADVLAKTALILGVQAGRTFIEAQPGCAALFVDAAGDIIERTANLMECRA